MRRVDAERRRGRKAAGGSMGRRNFLKLAAGAAAGIASAGLLSACQVGNADGGAAGETQEGRLLARPAPLPPGATAPTGLQRLGLDPERDGLLYVPPSYDAARPAPLALMLHGAGGDARGGLSPFLGLAEGAGLVLLAPESRGNTWDVLVGGYGPDVRFIDRALELAFGRLAVDEGRLAVAGFSDGASYGLSLGLTNGDLFGRVIAFSPGFSAPAAQRGEPRVFVSHGTRDRVLPIERTSRRIVAQLEQEGYEVRYREFDGPHTVPEDIAREALGWWLAVGASPAP